jgi:hypothetical protein
MMKIHILTVLLVITFLAGCRRHDWRELVIHVPEMHNEAAIRMVVQALSAGPGIKPDSVMVDPVNRKVHITYDSLLAADMNYVHLVAGAGFRANDIPGDPKAREAWPADVQL